MQHFPEFKQYQDANIAISKTDTKKQNTPTHAHRCWMNIPPEKLETLGTAPFIFDCLISGFRYTWCAPAVVLLAAFKQHNLHRANKDGKPYAPYLDYEKGLIYGSPYQSDTQPICQLSRILDGSTFNNILQNI